MNLNGMVNIFLIGCFLSIPVFVTGLYVIRQRKLKRKIRARHVLFGVLLQAFWVYLVYYYFALVVREMMMNL
ncbi:hypothetical protein IPM62_00730 [Candidatus Woesebacteria bacterium]|nr:MAG: hypothetical protein IPM62_00730 [Candidatus Woesebacteria bacterium]